MMKKNSTCDSRVSGAVALLTLNLLDVANFLNQTPPLFKTFFKILFESFVCFSKKSTRIKGSPSFTLLFIVNAFVESVVTGDFPKKRPIETIGLFSKLYIY